MKQDKHIQSVPPEVMEQALSMAAALNALLAPYMLALTSDERRSLPKMGEKSIAFVDKAYEFAQANPHLCPQYLDMNAFAVDYKDARGLVALQNAVIQISEQVADTAMTAGSEAYQAALIFYRAVKEAAAQDVRGARAVYEELRKRFPHGKRINAEEGAEK